MNEDYEENTDPNLESPAFGEVASEAKTTIAPNPLSRDGAGVPSRQEVLKPKLTLPRPQSDSGEQPPLSPAPKLEFAVEVDQLVQKLEPAAEKNSAEKSRKQERLFTKEVILTIVGGLALVGGAVAYSRSSDDPKPVPEVAQPLSPPVKPATKSPAPEPPKTEAKVESRDGAGVPSRQEGLTPAADAAPEETRKATIPILSILSSPSGARVEINGTIYGTTPLIQPSPPNVKSLSIRLLKDNYKDFETLLTPNEAGHFNLNATLEKR